MTPIYLQPTHQNRAAGPAATSDVRVFLPTLIAAPGLFYGLADRHIPICTTTMTYIDLIGGLALVLLAVAQLPALAPAAAWLTAMFIGTDPLVPDTEEVLR